MLMPEAGTCQTDVRPVVGWRWACHNGCIAIAPDNRLPFAPRSTWGVGRSRTTGVLTITPRWVQHYVPSYAMRIEAGRALVFSADAAPCDELVEHAAGADVLLCESAILDRSQDVADPAQRGHMSAVQAGAVAAQAGVGRLLITHAPLDTSDPQRVVREAGTRFTGPIERVMDGRTYVI